MKERAQMGRYQITHATKSTHHHDSITLLGAASWTRTRDDLIAMMDDGDTFFTSDGRHTAEVRVHQGRHGRYVQTVADGVLQDNLLYLPPCVAPVVRYRRGA